MTKREETIKRLTTGIFPRDKQILIDFWNGNGYITPETYKKYKGIIEEFDRVMMTDSKLEEFLEDTKNQYKAAWR